MAAIDYLYQSGLSVAVAGGKLRVSPAHLITDTLRQYVRDHRDELLTEAANDPPPETLAWLARVARLLECSPAYLLDRGFIDQFDLEEQHTSDPARAAVLIRSNPDWAGPGVVTTPDHADSPGEPQRGVHTAATVSPEWIAVRDRYIGHLMTCRSCHAPLGRYCATGAYLCAQYAASPWS